MESLVARPSAMMWLVTIVIIAGVIVAYIMLINGAFLRCPYCGKMGSWRFDDLGRPVDELDDDGDVIKSKQRQSCQKCGNEVIHSWSDYAGREIRKVD